MTLPLPAVPCLSSERCWLQLVPVDHAETAKHYVLSADDLALVRQSDGR